MRYYHYNHILLIVNKSANKLKADRSVNLLLKLFKIAPVNLTVLKNALNLNFKDYEDAVIYSSGLNANCHCVVTRNTKDFIQKEIPVLSPEQLLEKLNS